MSASEIAEDLKRTRALQEVQYYEDMNRQVHTIIDLALPYIDAFAEILNAQSDLFLRRYYGAEKCIVPIYSQLDLPGGIELHTIPPLGRQSAYVSAWIATWKEKQIGLTIGRVEVNKVGNTFWVEYSARYTSIPLSAQVSEERILKMSQDAARYHGMDIAKGLISVTPDIAEAIKNREEALGEYLDAVKR